MVSLSISITLIGLPVLFFFWRWFLAPLFRLRKMYCRSSSPEERTRHFQFHCGLFDVAPIELGYSHEIFRFKLIRYRHNKPKAGVACVNCNVPYSLSFHMYSCIECVHYNETALTVARVDRIEVDETNCSIRRKSRTAKLQWLQSASEIC